MKQAIHMDHVKFCANIVNAAKGRPMHVYYMMQAYWYALCMADSNPQPTQDDIAHMYRLSYYKVDLEPLIDLWRTDRLTCPTLTQGAN